MVSGEIVPYVNPQSQPPTFDGDRTNFPEVGNNGDDRALVCVPEARVVEVSSSSHPNDELHVQVQLIKTLKQIIARSTVGIKPKQTTEHKPSIFCVDGDGSVHIIPMAMEELGRRRVATNMVGETLVHFKLPEDFPLDDVDNIENLVPKDEKIRESTALRSRQFSFAQRLGGWRIECKQRFTGAYDMYYKHIRSETFLRSRIEVVNFILYEAYPHDKPPVMKRKAEENVESPEKFDQKRRKRCIGSTSQKRQRKASLDKSLAVVTAMALLEDSDENEQILKCDREDEEAPSPPPTVVSSPHLPQRDGDQASPITDPALDDQANNPPTVDMTEPNPSPDQQVGQADDFGNIVNPPELDSTDTEPMVNPSPDDQQVGQADDVPNVNLPHVDGTEPMVSPSASPHVDSERNPTPSPEQTETVNDDAQVAEEEAVYENLFEELPPLEGPDFGLPEINDDADENLFEGLSPLKGSIFSLPGNK